MAGPVVASNVLTPGFALRVDLVSGDTAVGGAVRRACVLAAAGSSGTAVANAVNQALAGADAAKTLLGAGVPGHLAIKAIFTEYRLARVDLVAYAEPSAGVKATMTITFDATTPVSVLQTVLVNIAGRDVVMYWQPAQSAISAATALVTAINALDADLPVVASNGGGTLAVVTLTFKIKGTHGNDCLVSVLMSGGAGGLVTPSGAALSSGTAEPDITTALQTIAGTEYDLILLVTSNTDAVAASTTSGPGRLKTHITGHNSGFGALLQQAVVGVTGTLSAAKAGPAQHNAGFFEYVFFRNARSLGCEFGGAEVGARLREEAIDVNTNRTNRQDMPYVAALYAPASITTDALSPSELEDALQSGLSAGTYTNTGVCVVSIPRTTYWKDTAGNPDHRLVFVSQPTSLYAIAKDFRQYLPARFPDAKLSPDIAPGDEELPEKVVDETTLREVIIARTRLWQRIGVVQKGKLDAAIKDGSLSVRVDTINGSKVNIQLPLSIIPPLTIWDFNILGGS